MTFRRLSIAIATWLCLLAAPAFSQAGRDVPVRAVEHPEYSRLVLPLAPEAAVAVTRSGATAVVRLEGPGPRLDVDSVFERMPRTRILSVRSAREEDGSARLLTLSLACSCAVETKRLGAGFLAIDVRRMTGSEAEAAAEEGATSDSPSGAVENGYNLIAAPEDPAPPAENQPADMARSDAGSAPAVPPRSGAGSILRPVRTFELEGNGFLEEARLREPLQRDRSGQNDMPDLAHGETSSRDAPADPVLAARATLLRELERAADEGLLALGPEAETELDALSAKAAEQLEPPPTSPREETLARRAESVPSLPDLAPPPRSPRLTAQLVPQLTIRGPSTAYPELTPRPQEEVVRGACPGDAALDVRSWAVSEGEFADRLGALRRALVDDSGAIDPGAVGALARHYIANGFGREAALVLSLMGQDLQEQPLLHDVAELLEGRAPATGGPVAAATECLGRVTLWRAAAGLEALDLMTPAGREIEAALLELPPVLRRLVGQAVARHALVGGASEAARHVIGILDRTPGVPNAAEVRVRARLALHDGAPEVAMALLAPAMAQASPEPLTLEIFAEAVLARGAPGPEGLSIMLSAAAAPLPEAAGSGLRLRLLQARLDAAEGAPLEALAALRDLDERGRVPGAEVTAAARDILVSFDPLAHPPDVAARVIMENARFLGEDAQSANLRLTYAEALLVSGLPGPALRVLGETNQLPTANMRLLAAAAQLKLGAPEKALTLLAPVEGEPAARLRAEAHVRRGDFTAGFEALRALDPSDPERRRLALLARRWEALGTTAPTAEAPLARLAAYAREEVVDRPATDAAASQTLTRDTAAAALTSARELQSALEDLSATTVSAGP